MSIYTLMPLHPSLGLAVIGLDLGAPIDAETAGNLPRLLAEHLVLVFPQQSLTPEQYVTVARLFGPPLRPHHSHDPMPGHPDIGVLADRDYPRAATWYTDHAEEEQPAATMLYGVEIPSPSGGGTSIADMRAAYWTLPDDERSRLDTMNTVNRLDPAHSGAAVVHPMVRTHPVSRERSIHLHPGKAAYIEGMTAEASRAYLDDLETRLIQPEIVYHHQWVKGDVVVIDGRATLCRAHSDAGPADAQVFWRIIVEGDPPASP